MDHFFPGVYKSCTELVSEPSVSGCSQAHIGFNIGFNIGFE